MDSSFYLIIAVLLIAYLFDFINGFHDASNSIATIVATGVLTPRQAVLWAAVFNFLAFLIFNLMVAKAIGSGLIDPHIISTKLILSALLAAIFWGLLTWYFGLPSSSSQALIGGLAGAAIIKGGFLTLKPLGFIKVVAGIFISPLIGLMASIVLTYLFTKGSQNKKEQSVSQWFKGFQLASSALLSLTHGGNDAQKTMGIIALLLFASGWLQGDFYVPTWVVISCQGVIALGTLFGGWRIVHTLGYKITHLNSLKGCAAEAGAALVIFISTECGVPVSTTQTVTGSISGVGLIAGGGGTHWPVIRIIFISWILTIPLTALLAALIFKLIG